MRSLRKMLLYILPVFLLAVVLLSQTLCGSGKRSDEDRSIGERFHHETSLTWLGALGDAFRGKPEEPPQYKTYPGAEIIELPEPVYRGLVLEEAIAGRRSVRNYSTNAMTSLQLSQLLFAAQGITGKTYDQYLRTAPSAGATYPFEIYVVVHNVENLPQGIYHYAVLEHGLALVRSGDFRDEITGAGLDQEMLGDADVVLVMSAIFNRTRHTYLERGFRYVYIEAGHISQNLYLEAVSLGLGSVAVGAFLDEKINELIGVDGHNEAAVYLQAVGTL
jgi:SagB-type dehydrogenase family enzyme